MTTPLYSNEHFDLFLMNQRETDKRGFEVRKFPSICIYVSWRFIRTCTDGGSSRKSLRKDDRSKK